MEDTNTNPNGDLARAKNALRSAMFHELRGLEVELAGDSLVISGRVQSFYHKQMAQETVRAVCKSIELKNSVDVDHDRQNAINEPGDEE